MKEIIGIITMIALISCGPERESETKMASTLPIVGTWRLLSGTLIEKGDTTITDYSNNTSFLKIINATHFSFLHHDLKKGKDSTAVFSAGGGRYFLADSTYTEHLEYCTARKWEGNDFKFTITIKNDTLVQTGIEKIEAAGVNRLNIETYVREK